ncbi:DegT/DnrJ/EryC1/StrS family aminotransferase [Patescibacteria group bacterium]
MRPIAISLSPNTQIDDVKLAFRKLFSFWKEDKSEVKNLNNSLTEYFGDGYQSFTFNSGRAALYVLLKSIGIERGDEVVVQAFTCSAVVNPIKWLGAMPVYADIGPDYNIDPKNLKTKISKKTKAIIVQHTFGIPADMNSIKDISSSEIVVIEDLAHGLGGEYLGKKLGTLTDTAFLSFGRDKSISSVFGGAVIVKNRELIEKLRKIYSTIESPNNFWTFQQVLHPVAFAIILPLYNFGYRKITLGKLLLWLFQELHLLSKPVSECEKNANKPSNYPKRLPSALSELANNQFKKLDKFVDKRREAARIYREKLSSTGLVIPKETKGSGWLRFPILVDDQGGLLGFAKKEKVLLGNWYKGVIMPSSSLDHFDYVSGSCPVAEDYSSRAVNLPTYPNMTDQNIVKVIYTVKKWLSTKQKK